MLLGITEGKLNLEAGTVEAEEAFRCPPRSVLVLYSVTVHRLRVGAAGKSVHDLQPALSGLAMQFGVSRSDLLVRWRCAGHATPKPAHAPGPALALGHEADIHDQQCPNRSGSVASKVARAIRAKRKGRANQRAWVRADLQL